MPGRWRLFVWPLAISCAASGWGLAAQSRSAWQGVYSADQADRGRRLYLRDCAECHGANLGGGDGGSALVGTQFLARWNTKAVGDLFDVMRKTMPDSAPGSLTERQYLELVAYVLKENAFPAGAVDLAGGVEALAAITLSKP